jgi:hypothetical protein
MCARGIACLGCLSTVTGAAPLFVAAYLETGIAGKEPQLTAFPAAASEQKISLPPLPRDFRLIAFGPDGRSLYGQRLDPGPGAGEGIIEVDIRGVTSRIVPGSVGLHTVWTLTLQPPQGKVILSAGPRALPKGNVGRSR